MRRPSAPRRSRSRIGRQFARLTGAARARLWATAPGRQLRHATSVCTGCSLMTGLCGPSSARAGRQSGGRAAAIARRTRRRRHQTSTVGARTGASRTPMTDAVTASWFWCRPTRADRCSGRASMLQTARDVVSGLLAGAGLMAAPMVILAVLHEACLHAIARRRNRRRTRE